MDKSQPRKLMAKGELYKHITRGKCKFVATHPDDPEEMVMFSEEDATFGEYFGCDKESLTEWGMR